MQPNDFLYSKITIPACVEGCSQSIVERELLSPVTLFCPESMLTVIESAMFLQVPHSISYYYILDFIIA